MQKNAARSRAAIKLVVSVVIQGVGQHTLAGEVGEQAEIPGDIGGVGEEVQAQRKADSLEVQQMKAQAREEKARKQVSRCWSCCCCPVGASAWR